MPPLDVSVVDTQAVALINQWISESLVGYETFEDWQLSHFGTTNDPNSSATADPDRDLANNAEEYLTGTNPTNAASFWAIDVQRNGDAVTLAYPRLINRGIEMQWSTALSNTSSWQFLDVPANRPFISATNGTALVPDTIDNVPAKFYRARVFEP